MAEASTKRKSSAKKTGAKKAQSGASSAKKTKTDVTQKSTSKSDAVKKSTTKATKSAAKKTVAKKAATKKTAPGKKTATKKTVAKKTAMKKATSSKKSSAKAAASKSKPKKGTDKKTKAAEKKSPTPAKSTKTSSKSSSKPSSRSKANQANLPEFPTTSWGPDSVISFEPTEHLPPAELTCIAGGIIFQDDKMLLANVPGRGWEIIGGRIDIGETPEDTFRREAERQVGVTLSHIRMLGVIRIEHQGPEPPNCPYPFPVGYGVQYIGIVDELLPFTGNSDSLGRSLITQEGIRHHYYEWSEYIGAVFSYAYDVYTKWKKKLKL